MLNKNKIYIGTSGWSYDDWRGKFYPQSLPKKNWLNFYATKFKTVELNATFYRFFEEEIYLRWYNNTPKNFRYVVKVPRLISHIKKLKETHELIQSFCSSISLLKEKLALILLQLPPQLPYDLDNLERAILSFAEPKKLVLEFRDPKWINRDVKKLLKRLNCIFCINDSPIIQLNNWLTGEIAYIRMHGHNQWYNYNYSTKELKKISILVKNLIKKRAKKLFVFFNNDHHAYASFNALYLQKILNN